MAFQVNQNTITKTRYTDLLMGQYIGILAIASAETEDTFYRKLVEAGLYVYQTYRMTFYLALWSVDMLAGPSGFSCSQFLQVHGNGMSFSVIMCPVRVPVMPCGYFCDHDLSIHGQGNYLPL